MPVPVNAFVANITLVFVLWSIPSAAQNTDEAGSLRARWESIAESVIVKIPPAPGGRLKLIVETETDRAVVENSFLAALGRRNIEVTMGNEQSPGEISILRISGIVNQGTAAVQTGCDARWEQADGSVRFLGRFHAERVAASPENGTSGTLERIIEPLVVIASAMMVVYLFFTVRS